MRQLLVTLIIALFTTSCAQQTTQVSYIPAMPSYADSTCWHRVFNDDSMGADVFYIPSTWEYDWYTTDSVVCHYADVANPTHRAHMDIELTKVASYMADGNNFYAPYYRHITLDTWATLNEDTINRRYFSVAFVDIEHAFDYYLNHYNHGRPFILAGFSQGAKSVVELMKLLSPDVRKRLIAAYVLGYKVTPADTIAHPNVFIGATGADDIGVTICYNSVSDVRYIKPIVSTPNLFCINPINWHTDDTPATLYDTITVTLSPDNNVLVVKGYDGSMLPNILNILNTGDYHGIEPWLYSESLRKNFRQRIRTYYRQHDIP